jgi:hypothetical protein
VSAFVAALDAALPSLIAADEALMRDTCMIATYPASPQVDAAGGWTDGTPTTVSVSCRLEDPSKDDQVIADRIGKDLRIVVAVPLDTVITIPSTLTTPSGEMYTIFGTNDEKTMRTSVRILAGTAG